MNLLTVTELKNNNPNNKNNNKINTTKTMNAKVNSELFKIEKQINILPLN